jgi:hypothetical protein
MTPTQHCERLPNRRIGETFELEVAGLRYTATNGRFSERLRAESKAAKIHAGGDEVVPFLPPRSPGIGRGPEQGPVPEISPPESPLPVWHGITAATIEVDYQLALELSPQGTAVKILVERGSPAWKAGLRTGDYLVSIGDSPTAETSFEAFAALDGPMGREIFARYHRPGRNAGLVDTAVFRLIGRRTRARAAPRWQRGARVSFGRVVERGADRARFEAEMAAHRALPPLAFKILVRLLRYYDGKAGAFPSYRTLAQDVGYSRRRVIDNVACLNWLGIVEVLKQGGRKGNGGRTNLFIIHWPAPMAR